METKGKWDKLANKYDELWVQKYSLEPTRKAIIELLRFRKNDFSLLDIGCGTGQLVEKISERFTRARLKGIDKSETMIEIAKSKNLSCDFVVSTAEELETDETFDVITCCHSFPYYDNKKMVLQKIAKLLKEDGRAIFIQGSINGIYDKAVFKAVELSAEKADYFSKDEFCNLAEEFFEIKKMFRIKKKWYMPSIYGFVLGRK